MTGTTVHLRGPATAAAPPSCAPEATFVGADLRVGADLTPRWRDRSG